MIHWLAIGGGTIVLAWVVYVLSIHIKYAPRHGGWGL